MYDKVDVLLQNVAQQIQRQGYSEMHVNWLALNLDTLTSCFLDRGMDLQLDENKARAWMETVTAVATSTPFAKQFTWFIPMASKLPMWVLERLTPEVSRLVKLRREMHVQATEAVALYSPDQTTQEKPRTKSELFSTILSSPVLDACEKEPSRISQEAFVVLVAGSDTTAQILTTGIFHILNNETAVMPRLRQELEQVMPDSHTRASVQELEKLPWLTAVGMTLRNILLDSEIFEDPESFRPERWLADNPDLAHINRYFLPFGRGSRMCIGVK
ncbi:hypothetical protein N0V90_002088 [Kalmusia sp. IMI 367209]|nr:hypothetical protein N0V90_002088 [Kalmusia sp. IMI 367209]